MKLTPSERADASDALNSAFVALDFLAAGPASADVWQDLLDIDLDNEDIDPSMDDVFSLLRRAAMLFPDNAALLAPIDARELGAVGPAFDARPEHNAAGMVRPHGTV